MNSPSSGSGKQVEVRGQEARGGGSPKRAGLAGPYLPQDFFPQTADLRMSQSQTSVVTLPLCVCTHVGLCVFPLEWQRERKCS